MAIRMRSALLLPMVLALLVLGLMAVPVVSAHVAATPKKAASQNPIQKYNAGLVLYRKYCGKCHALAAALSAGFGGKFNDTEGGPSFNNLKIPYDVSLEAIENIIAGHDVLNNKMTQTQIDQVCYFTQAATANHKILAHQWDG